MPTLLVANRGEIARRVIRTARRMGMRTVAVFSDADAGLPHVREADEAVRLGPAPARDSYLSIERIVAAARASAADLVHPGYGFLAEDPALARAVSDADVTFVGPPADVLALCGSKAEAKLIARRAGIPVLPGYAEEDQRDIAFGDAAHRIGYPVMVKPTAGGGGIGIQIVEKPAELSPALAKARRVALAAFGDERLMLEKLVRSPRHVEVQVLADTHDRVRTLGERDCSAQRRHQKIVEEAPAPHVTRWQRDKLAEAATAMAHASRYVGAGTVEFVMDERGDIYFLEVNARLQVEHTVTEEVTGFDLVEQQLRIALGERRIRRAGSCRRRDACSTSGGRTACASTRATRRDPRSPATTTRCWRRSSRAATIATARSTRSPTPSSARRSSVSARTCRSSFATSPTRRCVPAA
ncbi:MAG: ATP-grasp domain-containing protein [Chloroflexi bacterium]|nr:ATP-grasp domain-containing protein [Chloroflexota bacterium]